MHRLTITFFAFCLLVPAMSLQAQSALNPLNWFGGGDADEEEMVMDVASPAEEREAAGMLARGTAKLEAGNTSAANRIFKKIGKRYRTADAAGEARFLRAKILMTRGKWVKAFDSLQELIRFNPDFPEYKQVLAAQFECATALMEGARGRLLFFIPGFKQYDKAINQFERIVRNGPYSDYAPLALMNIALVAEQTNEPEIAIDALDRLINFYPQSMLAPDAYYNMAQTYSNLVKGSPYDQGATRQAISYYEDFLILFPESSYLGEVEANLAAMQKLLAESRLNLGNFYYYYRSNNTAALIFYNEAITIAPDSEAAEQARARIEDIDAGVRPVSGAQLVRRLFLID
jgi:outer membrane protein assembly factor BamD